MKVTVNHHHAVAVWRWNLKPNAPSGRSTDQPDQDHESDSDDDDDDDDVCGICRVAFDGCCPDCKVPGDGCPPIWGECTHVFHMHCLMKWLATDSSKQQCPMDRRLWVTAGTPALAPPVAPPHLAAQPVQQQQQQQQQDVDPGVQDGARRVRPSASVAFLPPPGAAPTPCAEARLLVSSTTLSGELPGPRSIRKVSSTAIYVPSSARSGRGSGVETSPPCLGPPSLRLTNPCLPRSSHAQTRQRSHDPLATASPCRPRRAQPSGVRSYPPLSSHTLHRRRSHSLHSSAAAAAARSSKAASSLFESLDLPASLISLREYLARRLEDAEHSLQALRAVVEEEASELELETETETEGDEGDADALSDDDDHDHDDGVREAAAAAHPTRSLLPHGRARPVELQEDLSALQAFIASASSFLAAMRDELPSLASTSSGNGSDVASSSCVQVELSPDARTTLDRFLSDHPLPSLPAFDLRSRAASSASAVLERAGAELRGVYDALACVAASAASGGGISGGDLQGVAWSSLLPYPSSLRSSLSLPTTPSLSLSADFAHARAYFSAESARLSHAASASLHRAADGAAELSAYVAGEASAALDEAKRMYHAALEIGQTRLLRYDELPEAWRNNEFVLEGYRYIPIERWGALLRSAFEWHNETVNIQSHFIGFLSLVVLLVYYLFFSHSSPHGLAEPHAGDTAIAVLFVISAMHCLLCSTTWHLFAGCATSHWHRGAACVDYVGISGLIAASVAGSTYYGFYEHPRLASAYMLFNLVVGVTGMVVPWAKWFNEREHKRWRVAFFCSLAASAVGPVSHRAWIYGLSETVWFYSPVIPSVAAYAIGLTFYAKQFPECLAPGSWHVGASHQLWHVAIVAAVWLHWKAMGDWSAAVALSRAAATAVAGVGGAP
ncbi:hemolysin-III related-domain-containing protein [Rhodotorula diobovata]|uniref:Anaphase-promoting complex subunit 11 n=1 Tax=Rhodotorula diobovata TaxID=5288 RepID=A0A5C5FZZ9_9BASI|nr:hemolysin-III related-domain-containing protein [Rhodotorula diobovata]